MSHEENDDAQHPYPPLLTSQSQDKNFIILVNYTTAAYTEPFRRDAALCAWLLGNCVLIAIRGYRQQPSPAQ